MNPIQVVVNTVRNAQLRNDIPAGPVSRGKQPTSATSSKKESLGSDATKDYRYKQELY
jgi:hypothetical protein